MKKKTVFAVIAVILVYLFLISLVTFAVLKKSCGEVFELSSFIGMFFTFFLIFTPKLLVVLSASLWVYELVRYCKHLEKKRFAISSAVYAVLLVLSVLIEIAMG